MRAPFLFWPFIATMIVVPGWLNARGPLTPVASAEKADRAMGAAATARLAVHVAVKGFLPLLLGLLLAAEMAKWVAPHARAWLQG